MKKTSIKKLGLKKDVIARLGKPGMDQIQGAQGTTDCVKKAIDKYLSDICVTLLRPCPTV